ncbi:MAG: hypothetical protein MI810_18230, partial [Flavobacteriales bacterium]|nr:hypothetical protein [Flavobacteriales bacterium]
RVERAMDRATAFLRKEQSADGQWVPLWFGNQHVQNEANPVYGTTKVMEGLLSLHPTRRDALAGPLEKALDWLLHQQNQDGGWGGALAAPSSHEETALALSAVATALRHLDASKAALAERSANALERGLAWLLPRIEDGTYRHVSPIGFYFAKLWYFEDLYPLVMTGAAMHQMDRLRHADPANQAKPLSANSEK